ncbi:hypothetical protein [Chryseobacterium indoltheticum]|uniref:Uncharacterized protein n=1 Tax=Chryseobacterium indoltheticum TaxID=254 RepID=A0A3G6N4I2_9FLAO|nr:hypothetical protein [Chryseobacterium indoltheticum]AZA62387.1 hypothetical protein EG340_15710 [Chryseobacterium indoltheticum]
MKNLFILIFSFLSIAIFSQNIKCEIIDYVKSIDNKEYSTYQYINSSYSYSRPFIVLVTSHNVFMEVHQKVPMIFSSKQEYTDVYLLGIKNFDKNNASMLDEKIIKNFIDDIVKYRIYNNLPDSNIEYALSQIKYLVDKDLCKFLICRKSKKL